MNKNAENSGEINLLAIVFLIILAASYVVNSMDRQSFPSLIPEIAKSFKVGLSAAGFLSTAFTLGIGVFGFASGYFVDKYKRKYVLLVGIFIFSIFEFLTGIANSYGLMLTVRIFSGVGEAVQNAVLFTILGSYFNRYRTIALGTLNAAYGLGGFIGPIIAVSLYTDYHSYEPPFITFGIIGLIFIPIIYLTIPYYFSEKVPTESKSEKIKAMEANVDSKLPSNFLNRNVILLIIIAAIVGFSMYGFLSLYVKFLEAILGFTPKTASFSLSLFGLGAILGIVAGWFGDVFNQKIVIIISFLFAMLDAFLMFVVVKSADGQFLLSFFEGVFGSGFLFTNTYSMMQRSVRTNSVGKASGLFVTSLYIPSALAGYSFGFFASAYSFAVAGEIQMVIFPIIGIIAAALVKGELLRNNIERKYLKSMP